MSFITKVNSLDMDLISIMLGSNGNLRILEWLRRYRFQLDLKFVHSHAQRNNHMHVIEWLNTL